MVSSDLQHDEAVSSDLQHDEAVSSDPQLDEVVSNDPQHDEVVSSLILYPSVSGSHPSSPLSLGLIPLPPCLWVSSL